MAATDAKISMKEALRRAEENESETTACSDGVSRYSGDCLSRGQSLSLFRDIPITDLDAAAEKCEPKYLSQHPDVPVVIVSSEISPWSKSGGLALVTASLSVEFAERGHRTMAISPMYDHYEGVTFMAKKTIWLMGNEHEVSYFHKWQPLADGKGVDYVFVDHECYHRPGGLYYNQELGVEYADNLYRFALFALAAVEAPCCVAPGGVCYGERVCFMANDWQSALVPVYLTHRYRRSGRYRDARCLFVVHNFGYQGIYPHNKLESKPGCALPSIVKNIDIHDFGLDDTPAYEHMVYQYPDHDRSYDGDDGNVWNLTKGALMTCDRLLTVSKGYASEMKTPEGGFRLEGIAKQKEFFFAGILNGIDVVAWNPARDPLLAQQYDASSFEEGRRACKLDLQKKVGLSQELDTALVAFVGRLTDQKGVDIILSAIDWMMTDTNNGITGHVQVLLMGNGDDHYVKAIAEKAHRWPNFKGIKFDPQIEHMLYAGSDLLLMPSRYEPCGLPQMCAQRYGCVPVVTLCGGLRDSVVVEPEQATGFGILPLTSCKFKEVTYKALDTYYNRREEFRAMQRRGMQTDFSWCPAIDEYEKNIDWALKDPPYVR
eukprot:TRINITY_DN56416_c0_g1_i1.p2 TRINITY_DN56416_c0_g1~~TRINITY_DN56416_c0_g1_i1.p2  ORF type:complete len:601 (-),score=142.91 TRINITY_DN56416_c0_g1_i1:103-1905(-)